MGGSAIAGVQEQHPLRCSASLNSASQSPKPGDNVLRSLSEDSGTAGLHFSLDDFDLGRVIGTGSCSYVRVAHCKSLKKSAVIKTYSKAQLIQSSELRHCRNELQAFNNIRSVWIPRLLGTGQTSSTVFLAIDFVQGGELFRLLRSLTRFTLREVEFYAAEVVCALCDLHMWRFIYRDLKPEHLLLDSNGHLRMVDLHLAKFMKYGGRTYTFCGTPEYLAPEMVERTGVGYEADWWQFGVLLYELLSGKTPFYDSSPYALYTNILTAQVRFPGYFSHSACSLIAALLNKQPKKRPSESQIKGDLFFSVIDWELAEKKQLPPPLINRVSDPMEDCHFEIYPQAEEFGEDETIVEESFAGF